MKYSTFVFKKYWLQIIIAALVFGGMVIASIQKPEWHTSIAWLESIAGAGTLFFAFFLWTNSIQKEWEENLPKRLTVQYQYQGRNVMVCYDALLVSESDARTWALQIGQQMSGCQKLKFEPFFNLLHRGIQEEKTTGKKYKSYLITYYLTELPLPDNGTDEEKKAFRDSLEKGCIERYPQYHQDGTVSIREGYEFSNKQKMTIAG